MKIYTVTYSSYYDGMLYGETKTARTREEAQKIFDNLVKGIAEEQFDEEAKSEIEGFLGEIEMAWENHNAIYSIKMEKHDI